jgi:rhamnose transport system ATP-binding protein
MDSAPPAGLRLASKRFGGTVAIEGVSFNLAPGQVLALLGENGAGKSTCVKLLAGLYQPDAGSVQLDGDDVRLHSPFEARQRGIATMHQHPGLFADLSVVENIFMGHMPLGGLGTIARARMERDACQLLEEVGLGCSPDERLGALRTSEQQLVEIARALSLKARVLIMDEPTAALSQREVERLFSVVSDLKKRRVAMMFVGHRMDEIYRVADRIAVLRDGHLVGLESAGALDRDRAVSLMIGRALSSIYPSRRATIGKVVMDVQGLSRGGVFRDVSFKVHAGEILGFGGLVGSGRTEIARVLFGVDQRSGGTVIVDGRSVAFRTPSEAMQAGIAYVSEDRLGQSLVMDFSVLFNGSLTVIGKACVAGLVRRARELGLVKPQLERLRLKFSSFDQPVRTLSGGNQQKVVLSKWLATEPRILILDEPTQGIDVQAKAEVHAMMTELAGQGLGIILISSELPELIGMCDRILVLREGEVTATFAASDVDQARVIRAATDADSASVVSPGAGPGHSGREDEQVSSGTLRRLVARREFGLLCAIAAVVVPAAVINPRVLSVPNLTAIAMDAALLVIVAVAQMLVMLTRNIDLSVASVIGLSAYGAASFMHAFPELPIVAGVAAACTLGLASGLLNGLVVTLGRVPSIVVTLGSLTVLRGLTSLWAGGKQISADQVPQAWLDLTSANLLGVPAVVVIAGATLAVAGFVLHAYPAGRQLYATGSNPDGAALIGIRSTLLILAAFATSGLLAGFDGALWASRYATVDARVATGYELTVIAAVVVGGVAVRGGAGSVVGVALGAILLLVIQNGLTLARVDPLWLQGAYGLVILVAVGLDAIVAGRVRIPGMRTP